MSRNPDGTFSSLVTPLNPASEPPTDLSVAQFILDSTHPLRPIRDANSPWLIEDETGRGIGYEEVRSRTWGLANSIKEKWPSIVEDDVVCIFSPNNVDYPIVVWAAHRLSLTVACVNPDFTEEELLHQLTVTRSKLLFCHPQNVEVALKAAKKAGIEVGRVVSLMAANRRSDPAGIPTVDQLVNHGITSREQFKEKRLAKGENKTKVAVYAFSSGTTGKPKAVAIPHYAIIANIIQCAAFNRLNDPTIPREQARYRKGDVNLGVLPMFHIFGLVAVLHLGLFAGLPLVVIPKFNYVNMLKSIVKYRITNLSLVPPQILLLCKHPATKSFDLSHCHFAVSGGAPIPPELAAQFMCALPNIRFGQGFGMTETAAAVSSVPLELAKTGGVPGSVGRLLPNTTVKIIKPDGTLAGYNEPGELVVTGPQMTLRYENNPAATKETFVDGWVHTGDVAMINKDGDVFIVGRLKELIKVRAFQVAPAELEGHLMGHPWIDDVAVIGFPDEFSGEVPLAFVVLSDRGKESRKGSLAMKRDIFQFVADKKVKYKWLEGGIVFVDAIPKSPSGKVLRRVLNEQAKTLTEAERGVQSRIPKL